MRRGLKRYSKTGANGAAAKNIECPDEKGTETAPINIPSVLEFQNIECPDEKGTETMNYTHTPPYDWRKH